MELIIYNIILYSLFHNYLAQAFFKIIKKYFTYVNFLLSPLSLHVNTIIMVSCLTKDQLCSFICLSADIYIFKFLSFTAMLRMSVLTWESYIQPNCLKGRVVCGTVYGEMHLKDLLGSFIRVGHRIPVPDFYLVLHGLRCRKSTIMD